MWFSFGVNLACSVAITAASLVLTLDSGRGFLAGIECPSYLSQCQWSVWEFFTGFIFGFFVMLIIVLLPKKYTKSEEDFEYSPLFKSKKAALMFNSLFTLLFAFGIILSRAFSFRFLKLFIDSESLKIVLTVVLSVICFIPCYKTAKKNIVDRGLSTPVNMSVQRFSSKALPIYIAIIGFIYFFLGDIVKRETVLKYDYSKLFTASGFTEYGSSGALFEHIMMLAAFAVFFVSYGICTQRKRAE